MNITENHYNEIYNANPDRDRLANGLKENFSEDFKEYHQKFVTYIHELREKARKLNLPLSINPTIDGIKMLDNKGNITVNQTQLSFLIGMIREAKSYEPDYL